MLLFFSVKLKFIYRKRNSFFCFVFSASSLTASTTTRPSSLHGLKHKHKLGVKTKTLQSPSRRKSVGHIPLSPLARTPSPSPIPPISPTRSPSPLALPLAGKI